MAYMLQAVEATAIETRRRIESIHEAIDQAKESIRESAPKLYNYELIELIFSQPYTHIHSLEEAGIAKRQTPSGYLKKLEELGILVSVKVWRETLYLNPRLMELLAA